MLRFGVRSHAAGARMLFGPRHLGGVADVLDPTRSGVLVRRVDLAGLDAVLDHLERQEVLALLAEDAAQEFHVVAVELAVTRRRAFRIDQALALEEPDLGDRDIGELLEQQGEHLTDGEVSVDRRGRRLSHRDVRRRRVGTCRSAARHRGATPSGRFAPD